MKQLSYEDEVKTNWKERVDKEILLAIHLMKGAVPRL